MTIQIPIHDIQGQPAGTLEVDEQLLGGHVRVQLLKQAYVRVHANNRQGTSATRTRGQVNGSGKKMYRQKGTGNARRGDRKTNVLRGGGHAKGKQYIAGRWRQDMPVKMRRLANRNALLAKLVDVDGTPLPAPEIKLVENLNAGFAKPSTKQFASLLSALQIDASCLIALSDTRSHEARSARNLEGTRLTHIDRLNAFDVLATRYLLADRATFEAYLERLREWAHKKHREKDLDAIEANAAAAVQAAASVDAEAAESPSPALQEAE